MPRMTITLSDEIHQALKETSLRQHRPIAAIIEESLRFRGIKTQMHARALVQSARTRGDLNEENALTLAVEETRKVRRGK
jgi:predicted DNA-binding protein